MPYKTCPACQAAETTHTPAVSTEHLLSTGYCHRPQGHTSELKFIAQDNKENRTIKPWGADGTEFYREKAVAWGEGHGFAALSSGVGQWGRVYGEEVAFGQHVKVERKGSRTLSGKAYIPDRGMVRA